jgi:hypothetical protein
MNHDERIRSVGGVNPDGTRWRMSHRAAIAAIDADLWSFYIARAGRTLDVIVAISKYDRKYLKTTADRLHPDNLLALPECS